MASNPWRESNPRREDLESAALPLSYRGRCRRATCPSARAGSRFLRTHRLGVNPFLVGLVDDGIARRLPLVQGQGASEDVLHDLDPEPQGRVPLREVVKRDALTLLLEGPGH